MQIYLILALILAALAAYLWLFKNAFVVDLRQTSAAPQPLAGYRRHRELFEHSSDAIFVVDVSSGGKFRFESLNPAAMQVLDPKGLGLDGKRFDDLSGRSIDLELRRVLQSMSQHLKRAVQGGMPLKYHDTFDFHPGQAARSFEINLVPMVDDAGLSHVLCFAKDVTAQQQYVAELQKRTRLEERLSGFVASAPGFFYSFEHGSDGSNSMPFASAGIRELFGLRPEDVASSIAPMNMLMHQDDMGRFFEATACSAADMSLCSVEFRVQHPERGLIWIESRAMPTLKDDGGIVWHGFMHEVNDRKLAEQRLAEAHAFTEGVINTIPDPVFVKDREHRWVMLNDACCALIGQPRERLIGKSDYDFFAKEQAAEFQAADERVFASGQVDLHEEAVTVADGVTRYLQTKKTPYHANGEQLIIAVIRDITARRMMEDSLRHSSKSLAEAQRIGQMGSWELNLATGKAIWSDEMYRIYEVDPALCDGSGEAAMNAIHSEDIATVQSAHREAMAEQIPFKLDYRLLFPDGRVKYVRENCEMHHSEEGRPVHLHGTVQDITALKVTELQLKDTQDKLRELVINRELLREDERKRIAWEMHEELGQLLAAVKMRMGGMRTQLQKNAPMLLEDSHAVIGLIDKSIKTVHEIVSDLRPTVLLHGPVAALEWLAAEFNKHPGMECQLQINESGNANISEELTTLVFRIAQEALESAVRHAGVTCVLLFWGEGEDEHCLRMQHDGESGITDMTGEQSLNLFGMQERVHAFGGEMKVYSTLERGSVIEACFPDKP